MKLILASLLVIEHMARMSERSLPPGLVKIYRETDLEQIKDHPFNIAMQKQKQYGDNNKKNEKREKYRNFTEHEKHKHMARKAREKSHRQTELNKKKNTKNT